ADQRAPEIGQLIIDARRNRRIDGPRHQPIAFETTQSERQHALRYAADRTPELVETHWPILQQADHVDSPFIADARQQVGHHLAVGSVMADTGFQKSASLRGLSRSSI